MYVFRDPRGTRALHRLIGGPELPEVTEDTLTDQSLMFRRIQSRWTLRVP